MKNKQLKNIAEKIFNLEKNLTDNTDSTEKQILNLIKDLSVEDLLFIDECIQEKFLTD